MKILHGRAAGSSSEQRSATFTGAVWADPVLSVPGEVMINTVFFSPGARTFWHTHERGQILQVTAGSGWICTEGGRPETIRGGDVVWIPAGERHWHGAAPESYMVHVATSLGKTDWQEAVNEQDYGPA